MGILKIVFYVGIVGGAACTVIGAQYLPRYYEEVPRSVAVYLERAKRRTPWAMVLSVIIFFGGDILWNIPSVVCMVGSIFIQLESFIIIIAWSCWVIAIYPLFHILHLCSAESTTEKLVRDVRSWSDPRWRRLYLWLLIILAILYLSVLGFFIYMSIIAGELL